MSLASKLMAVHKCLEDARIPHALGGAIALAYCTGDPRGTIDLDVNLFVGVDGAAQVIDALPEGVEVTELDRERIAADGQVRVWWEETAIDLFFTDHPFHEEIAERVRSVPFEGHPIPVLDCTDLVIFKAFFARTKDWGDVEAAAAKGSIDVDRAVTTVSSLLGEDDWRVERLREAIRAGRQMREGPTVLPQPKKP